MTYLHLPDAVREHLPGFAYRAISPAELHLRTPPRVMLGPVPRTFGELYFGDRRAPAVGLYTVENVVLRGDRFLRQGDYVLGLEQNGIHRDSAAQINTSTPPVSTTSYSETRVVLCGPAYQMYGHWLVDFLPRLHLLTYAGFRLNEIPLLLPHNIMPFAWQWIELLGIPRENICTYDVVTEECRLARAIIPTGIRGNGRANRILASAMRDFKTRIAPKPLLCKGRRLFVSRRGWPNTSRQISNIAAIEARFEAASFEVVQPESLGLAEQVKLFASASVIVGEYSSGLHNSIFAPSGTLVIALRGTEPHPGFLQSGLCEALEQPMGYLFCETVTNSGEQKLFLDDKDLDLLLSLLQETH